MQVAQKTHIMKKLILIGLVFLLVFKIHSQELIENFYGGCDGEIAKDAITIFLLLVQVRAIIGIHLQPLFSRMI